MRILPLLLLAGCAGAGSDETALLDGAGAEGLPGAWVVWRTAAPDLRVSSALLVERSEQTTSLYRGPKPGGLPEELRERDKAPLRVRRKEGVVAPVELAALEAALRAAPSASTGPYAVSVREPGGAVRGFSYAEPAALHDVVMRIAAALPESR